MIIPYPQFLWTTLWKECVQTILINVMIANITKLLKINHSTIIYIYQMLMLIYMASRGTITANMSKSRYLRSRLCINNPSWLFFSFESELQAVYLFKFPILIYITVQTSLNGNNPGLPSRVYLAPECPLSPWQTGAVFYETCRKSVFGLTEPATKLLFNSLYTIPCQYWK